MWQNCVALRNGSKMEGRGPKNAMEEMKASDVQKDDKLVGRRDFSK